MPAIRIKRMTGETVAVEVADAQHYEVNLEGRDPEGDPNDDYAIQWRHEVVVAATAAAAKKIARGLCVEDEKPVSARKLTAADVAVLVLHGAQVVR